MYDIPAKLATRFAKPGGLKTEFFRNLQGRRIRYSTWVPAPLPGADLLILGGYGEAYNNYFEVDHDLSDLGAQIWHMEWVGAGGSDRYLPDEPRKGHSEGFDEQIDTLRKFIEDIVRSDATRKLLIVAHSMGAHLALRTVQTYPSLCDGLVLSAPMQGINTSPIPRFLAPYVAGLLNYTPLAKMYAESRKETMSIDHDFNRNALTSDPQRFDVMRRLYNEQPDLRVGGATFGYVYHALRSTHRSMHPDLLRNVDIPVLMQISGDEDITDNGAAYDTARLLPRCQVLDIAHAKHHIWMERDELRQKMLSATRGFISQVML